LSQQTDRSRALRTLELNRAAEKVKRDHPGDDPYSRGVRDGVDTATKLLTSAKNPDPPELLAQLGDAKSHVDDGEYERGVYAGLEAIHQQARAALQPRSGTWSPGGPGRSPVENDRSARRGRG